MYWWKDRAGRDLKAKEFWVELGRLAHPPRGNTVVVTVVVVSGDTVLVVLSWGKPDASPSRDVIAELSPPSHVHLQDYDAKEITVLTRLSLSRHWRNLRVKSRALVATLC